MKLGVLHLSDIHFRHETDPARKYGECIAKACYESAHQSDEFIIVVTGDIAFGGQEIEYKYAAELLSTVSSLRALFLPSVAGELLFHHLKFQSFRLEKPL